MLCSIHGTGFASSWVSASSMLARTITALSLAIFSHLPIRLPHWSLDRPVSRRTAALPRPNRSRRGSGAVAALGAADPSGSEPGVFGVGVIGGVWGGKGEGSLGVGVPECPDCPCASPCVPGTLGDKSCLAARWRRFFAAAFSRLAATNASSAAWSASTAAMSNSGVAPAASMARRTSALIAINQWP